VLPVGAARRHRRAAYFVADALAVRLASASAARPNPDRGLDRPQN